MSARYGLAVKLDVYPVEQLAGGKFVRTSGYGNGLQIADELELGQLGFLEIAGVLHRFHELAEAIRHNRQLPAVPAELAELAPLGELPDLRQFRIYINESAQYGLACDAGDCPTGGDLGLPFKRVTVGILLQAIAAHRREHHLEPAQVTT